MEPDPRMVCPECGEPVETKTPEATMPWQAYESSAPEYAHRDGEPLCPVVGEHGYEPAQPAPAATAAEAAVADQHEDSTSRPGTVEYFDLEVCDDCAQVIANGEINDGTDRGREVAEAQVRVWGRDAVHLVLACGEYCAESFSWARCGGCGSTLGGNRHPASIRVAQAAHVAVDDTRAACPGCGEPVQRHPRWRDEPGLYTTLGINRDWIHTDGSPLCSMPAVHGYRPAHPVPAAAATLGSSCCWPEQRSWPIVAISRPTGTARSTARAPTAALARKAAESLPATANSCCRTCWPRVRCYWRWAPTPPRRPPG